MINLTPDAAKEIRDIMIRDGLNPEEVAISVGCRAGGCSGLMFTLDFSDKRRKFDLFFESQGLGILVDKKSHLFIDGTTIGWSKNLASMGLTFDNPKAKGSCSCRTSFIIDIAEPEEDVFKPTW